MKIWHSAAETTICTHQADGELVLMVECLDEICIPSRRCRVEVDGRGLDEDSHGLHGEAPRRRW